MGTTTTAVVLRRWVRALPLWILLATVLTGCGGDENALDAHSHAESRIAHVWWVMLGGSCVGLALIVGLLAAAWFRRTRRIETADGERRMTLFVVLLGVVVPVIVLAALFVWADIFVIGSTAAPPPGSAQLTVRVIAHQWWWEVRYPGTTAVTANEIHVPLDTRVDLVGTTDDVIHSLWIPELNRKIDLIPGRTGSILIDADKAGIYKGQCSEFCGVEHAHMTIAVIAESRTRFRAWLANMAKPARAPVTAMERRGEAVFLSEPCASCHTIRGTPASGTVGPDLTHLATRSMLAAETIPNQPDYLRGWIADPQRIKPGAKMPAVPLTSRQLSELVAYLDHLH